MTDEMKEIINSSESHMVVIARAGCVDRDTEFFDGFMWKKISEYKETDRVLQFNKDWTAELVKPKRYIKEPCEYMSLIKSKYGVDMVLSDEHRVIYVDTSHNKQWGEQNILEIQCRDMIDRHIKNKKGFYGKFITTFKLKDKGFKYFSCDDEIKMYMAVLSDGNIKDKENKIVRINLKKDRKKVRLVELLNNLGIEYNVKNEDSGFSVYTFKFEKATKEFDFKLLQMSEKDRKTLFDEIPYWDGHYEKFKKNGKISFFTTNKHNADFIQMLGASLNKRGTILLDDRVGQEQINSKGEIYVRKSICYNVDFTDKSLVSIGSHSNPNNRFDNISTYKTLDGYKYCFSVDSGMLVLRRNGRIFVTGNCGKSSTMLEYIKAHPNERVLFLVYNKSMEMEFKQKAKECKNVTISTIHSLAYKWFISNYGKRSFKNISIIDIKNILKNKSLKYVDLGIIKFYYDMYLCSEVEDPNELELLSEEDRYYIKYVKVLFEYFKHSDTIQHNVYLKLYQLAKVKIDGYDTIQLDEANDANMCMLSIIENNLDKKVIIIGDPLQNLNSFNYTVDGLTYMIKKHNFKEYNLTMSFRVSEEVANISSRYLSYMYDDKIVFHGNKHTKMVKLDLTKANPKNQVHLLCRNRLGGLFEVLRVLSLNKNKRIYYVGGIDSFGIEDIEKSITYNGYFYLGGEKFHVTQLRSMLDDEDGIKDPEIQRLVSIYDFGKKYEKVIPLLRYTETTNKKEADIIVQTAHSSKGLTVENVFLAGDFKPIQDIKKNMLIMKESGNEYLYNISKSEINLIYVALTRATNFLDMNEVLNRKEKQNKSLRIDLDNELDTLSRRVII